MPGNHSRLHQYLGLEYVEASRVLRTIEPRDIAYRNLEIDDGVQALRNNILRPGRAARLATIFAYGMGHTRFRTSVSVAPSRHDGYDFVLTWADQDGELYTPVKMGEVSATVKDARAAVLKELDELDGYSEWSDLNVAIYMNRRGRFEYGPWLERNNLPVSGVWLFGRMDAAANEWFIYGNLRRRPDLRIFGYPT